MLSITIVILAALAYAIMSLSADGKLKGNLNKAESWGNKWAKADDGGIIVGKERFLGSSTVFVFVTDLFHFSQFVFLNSLFISALPYAGWKAVLIGRVAFGLVFEPSYRFIGRSNV